MENITPEKKDIRIPPSTQFQSVTQASLPSFNAVAVRILRRSWVDALHEMQREQEANYVAARNYEFRDLLILFLKRSWILAIFVAAGFWFGHQRAAKLPDLYSSSALLVPTTPPNPVEQRDPEKPVVSPDLSLFGALMTSRTVMMQVLRSPVLAHPGDTSMTLFAKTRGIDTGNPVSMQVGATQLAAAIRLTDEGNGIFRLAFTSSDSFVVPQMADIILEATQTELTRVKTQRMSAAVLILQKRMEEAQKEYRKASSQLAYFHNRNVDMESGSLLMRQTELESELRMREQAYVQARERVDLARNELDQAYPPAMVFDPASRPAMLIGPNRLNQSILAAFIGLVLSVSLVLAWEFLLRKRPT